MSRRRTRLIIAILVLLLLLLVVGGAYLNYKKTRRIGSGIRVDLAGQDTVAIPQYLYSFSGEGAETLAKPLGVFVSDGRVYVTDARRGTLDVFKANGARVATWGKGKLQVPLYVAQHPLTKDIYVSDRRAKGVAVFSADGTFLRMFDPALPKSEMPDFDTQGVKWAPVALAFASDGTLYVTDILNGHRLLIFSADGEFERAVGTAGLVNDPKSGESVFQFPNSVKVKGEEVWVADSNNRRVQIFTRGGEFKRFIVTQGLPRGFDFIPTTKDLKGSYLVVIDTLAHDATIWNADKGSKVITFGEKGVLEAQFSYPNDVSISDDRFIFVADSANGRIQVWGWPETSNPVPLPTTWRGWAALAAAPLLLLPLLLFLRRKHYFATADFIEALYEIGELDRMPDKRVIWQILPEEFDRVADLEQNGVGVRGLVHPVEYSESDAHAIQDRYEIGWYEATALACAQRARVFCTENPELRRVARVLEIDVVSHIEFLSRAVAPQREKDPE